jgi:dTDP-4-amino-4,6-dideoxygalactose transaminase
MAQADGVQIVPFHQFEILAHQFFCHVMSGLRVVFVDIDTFELDRLSVEQQDGV